VRSLGRGLPFWPLITWMPEEPTPMTPTRLPSKLISWCGQLPVMSTSPSKSSMPGKSGFFGTERVPAPETTYRAR